MSYEREFKITGGIPDAYKLYKKDKRFAGEKILDKKIYSDICHEFNRRLSDKIIRESFEYKIPFGLGYLRVKSIKMRYKFKDGKLLAYKTCPNWHESKKLWFKLYPDKTWEEIKQIPDKKIIIHTNDHTDGKLMRWYWDKRLCHFTNQTAYTFLPVKGSQDKKYYEDENNPYYGRLGLAKWIVSLDRNNEYYE